jgi:DNA-binding phage protein
MQGLYQEVLGEHCQSFYTIRKVVSAMNLNLVASVRSEAVVV